MPALQYSHNQKHPLSSRVLLLERQDSGESRDTNRNDSNSGEEELWLYSGDAALKIE
jgi:hypothetical protein